MPNVNELNQLLTEKEFGIAKDIAQYIFDETNAETQEELNVKSALLKQAFLNAFEFNYELEFLKASEKL